MKGNSAIILSGFVGAFMSFGAFQFFQKGTTTYIVKEVESTQNSNDHFQTVNQVNPIISSSETNFDLDLTLASEKTVNAVVHIKTEYTKQYHNDPIMEYFRGRGGSQTQTASGSGVIISKDGYIATNNHVIEDADKIEVTLNNGETKVATLVGTDPSTDLALLKIEGNNLPKVAFANSDDVKIGEWVLAVGNPFNLTSTVTAGIVSAKSRNINILKGDRSKQVFPIESFIQTDAAVNPGNSGGALVNPRGELIGINTAIASKTGSYSGYSFAVPSNIVKKVTSDLMEFGVVQRAFIGVSLANINQDIMESQELINVKGVLVIGIDPNGAGFDSGIKEGDVILKVGTIEVNKVPELQEQISNFSPGDEAQLTIRSGGKEKSIILILKNKDGDTSEVSKPKIAELNSLGVSFEEITQDDKNKLRISNGVKVGSLGIGKFKSAGITEGFIILKIDQKVIGSIEEASAYLSEKKGGVMIEGIYPNGMKGYFGFGL
jgi:serine protease Do